jgi:hypothetical protein
MRPKTIIIIRTCSDCPLFRSPCENFDIEIIAILKFLKTHLAFIFIAAETTVISAIAIQGVRYTSVVFTIELFSSASCIFYKKN